MFFVWSTFFFLCQFGFMEPIKQTVENNVDSCLSKLIVWGRLMVRETEWPGRNTEIIHGCLWRTRTKIGSKLLFTEISCNWVFKKSTYFTKVLSLKPWNSRLSESCRSQFKIQMCFDRQLFIVHWSNLQRGLNNEPLKVQHANAGKTSVGVWSC